MAGNTAVSEFLLKGKDPQALALRFAEGDCSYGELERAVTRIAAHLHELGCAKGGRVVLVADNSLFWVASYLAILRSGLVCVPLPPGVSPQTLEYVVNTTETGVVFAHAGLVERLVFNLRNAHVVTDVRVTRIPECASHSDFASLLREPAIGQRQRVQISEDDLAALMFTSGSTGSPRGVMISHGNIVANAESIIQFLRLTADDRIMAVLPFHYCFGASLLHTHLRVGGCVVVDSRFMYPECVLERMIESDCTGFAGVPTHFRVLLRNTRVRRRQFPRLRYLQQAGGHLSPALVRELRAALPRAEVFLMYGQTEATARLSYLPPEFVDTKPSSIGKGIPGVRLRVLDEAGQEVRPGDVGEIVAEGKNIARGYWRAREESAKAFRDGRLYTGDLATVDDDGFIYVVDRAKDFLKCRGERVSCRWLEDQLMVCEELLEVAVIGIPDEVLGEAVKAFVVPREAACDGLVDRVRTFCKQRMPVHFLPRDIVVLDALPKSSVGKVLKARLRDV